VTRHVLDAVGSVRSVADDSREIEGIAIPYGVTSRPAELTVGSGTMVREVFMPGAFREDVAQWMGRQDGARMPFRPAHGQRSIGSVTHLQDAPEGVLFRAKIRNGAAGDEYLAAVRDGINGVSPEVNFPRDVRRMKDGTVVHSQGAFYAIAGSDVPAYDGARIALRDMEDIVSETNPPVPEPEPTPDPAPEPSRGAVTPIDQPTRLQAERDALSGFSSSIVVTRPEMVYQRSEPTNYMHDRWVISSSSLAGNKGEAAERIQKHERHLAEVSLAMERNAYSRTFDPGYAERASDVLSTEIPGAYPNDYLPGLLTPRILKGRPMGDFFNRIPIADARPRIFPKVTTSGTVATFAEGVAPTATDIATTAVSVTPSAYGTYTDVSRQALDGGDPSVLSIIFQDLVEAYRQASETAIKVAVEAGASASGTAITAATPWAGELANVVKYYATRFRPAEAAFVPSALYSVLLAQGDTTGRPFMPMLGPVNSDGTVNSGGVNGNILGAQAFLSWASTVNVNVFAVRNDYVIYESSIAQFTYDQVVGPQSVRVGLWAYLGIGTRLGGLSVTAA
jgi:phage head maturation protease